METDQPRKEQTRTIVKTIVLVALAFIGWQELTRDFSMMKPEDRCAYPVFVWKHGWPSQSTCRVAAAVALLSDEPFREDYAAQ